MSDAQTHAKPKITDPNALRQSFFDFMKARGSTVVPSASLLPENDPTTLFTGAGMQPMIPYLLGEKHPSGNDVANSQKCLRTGDINEVGDNSHLTFFEMVGRWAFSADPDTYKTEQIQRMWDWHVGELGIDPARLYVSVYQGNPALGIDRDDTAVAKWTALFESVGVDPKVEADPFTHGASRGGRIFLYDEGENWWSRAGVPDNMPAGEPGGPDSEMFYDFDPGGDPKDHPAADSPRFLEIGNNVFMALKRTADGFENLARPNIDYGGGLERIAAAINGDPDVYLTPFFTNAIAILSKLSGQAYSEATAEFRIVLDHARAATFLIGDGAVPSNVDAGYVTRRLIRRAVRTGRKLGLTEAFLGELAANYIDEASAYPELVERKSEIVSAISAEEQQFHATLQSGEKAMKAHMAKHDQVTGADAFYFYETFGFPLELTEEILAEAGQSLADPDGFDRAAKEHADKSRTAAAGKFKGGLADHSEVTTALHTATHLLLAGLREILGDHVHQAGSNITAERARFDFSHPEKMTPEQKQAVEDYVNEAIRAGAALDVVEMAKDKAREEGVEGSFWDRYPDVVKVYEFRDPDGRVWSQELCGGPHVDNTTVLAKYGAFKIKKEESSAKGVRRIKAVLTQ